MMLQHAKYVAATAATENLFPSLSQQSLDEVVTTIAHTPSRPCLYGRSEAIWHLRWRYCFHNQRLGGRGRMKTIDQSILVIPISTLTLQSEATELAMAVEANTEYVGLPEALSHRLEGTVL